MASKEALASLRGLGLTCIPKDASFVQLGAQALWRSRRSMATEAKLSPAQMGIESIENRNSNLHPYDPSRSILTTLYSFPTMEPLAFEHYSCKHLHLPLRRDILHRAVIYEGDKTRLGTASTKHRTEIHGGGKKIRPQKGTGRARLGDKKSPMLVGGGRAFGPKPRDFSTKLPKKIYDLAWRTALSYRYRRGQLIVVEDGMNFEFPSSRYARAFFEANQWGKADKRSLLVTNEPRQNLMDAMKDVGSEGEVSHKDDVDVKDILMTGRIIIEREALHSIIRDHQSDLSHPCILPILD